MRKEKVAGFAECNISQTSKLLFVQLCFQEEYSNKFCNICSRRGYIARDQLEILRRINLICPLEIFRCAWRLQKRKALYWVRLQERAMRVLSLNFVSDPYVQLARSKIRIFSPSPCLQFITKAFVMHNFYACLLLKFTQNFTYIKFSLFWSVTQRRMIVLLPTFREKVSVPSSMVILGFFTFVDGTNNLSRNVGN